MKCTDYHDSTDERSQYLKILNQRSESKTSDNAMMKEFIDTYKRYIQTYKDEYGTYRFVEVIGEIPRFPKLDEWFWRMFLIGWKRISPLDQIAITMKFPSIHDAKPLFEKHASELMVEDRYDYPFISRAVAIAVASIITDKFNKASLKKERGAFYDFVWVDYNFDMRDYHNISRVDEGWGILAKGEKYWSMKSVLSRDQFFGMVQNSLSLTILQKGQLLEKCRTYSDTQLQRYIDMFHKEAKALYLMDIEVQTTHIASKVQETQREWQIRKTIFEKGWKL
jgi:hypothetical protein